MAGIRWGISDYMIINDRLENLKSIIKSYESVFVAFSGGVDSTFLLKVAHDVLGDKCVAINVESDFVPEREENEARVFCENEGIRWIGIKCDILDYKHITANPENRCYLCKKTLFSEMLQIMEHEGFNALLEGSNMDDTLDYRPGMKAVKELGVKSPLEDAKLSKQEIREFSKDMGLPTWNKPSFACLATRFVYGEEITKEKLKKVEAAEQFLIDKGFTQVRVRMHGESLVRIEVSENKLEELFSIRKEVTDRFKSIGFTYITMDMTGYRTGAMNEVRGYYGKKTIS